MIKVQRRFRNIILTFYCAATFVSYGQINNSTKILLDSSFLVKNVREVMLLETDTFTIVTNYELFVENCRQFIKEYNLDLDKDLLKLFTSDNSKIIYADSVVKTNISKSRLVYRIADLLEYGQCLVYNKQNKILEKFVKTEKYTNSFVSGRRMKTKDNLLIYEVVDGVF